MMKHPLIGQEFHVDFQPYGPVDFIVEKVTLRKGRVVRGSVTNRLFQYTSTTRMKEGEPYWLSGVDKDEVLARRAIKVAM
jgi:hypothetical protein